MDPTQNNAQPPMANQQPTEQSVGPGSTPNPNVGHDSDLYAQIAGQDVEAPVVKKKRPSILMSVVTGFMRLTMYIDSLKRSHEPFFHFMGMLWAFFMGMLYLSGILVLLAAIYNRLQMPILLEDQLRVRNIDFESADYSMDRIIVHNLKDKNGAYTVDTLVVYSTFADLLQKRIRLVVLDGLNVFFDTKSDFNPVQDIPPILTHIQNPARGHVDLTVNAITVNNAKLNFKNRQMEIPISFSLQGSYARRTQIVMPVSVNRPSLQAEGTLSLNYQGGQPEWQLEITKGMVTLPRSSPEQMTGMFKMTLNNNQFDHLDMNVKLGYGTIEKHITATFQSLKGDDMAVNILWNKNNLTEPDQSSSVAVSLGHLSLKKTGQVHAYGQMVIDAKKFVAPNVILENLHTTFKGDIQCSNWTRCALEIQEKAPVTIQKLWFQYQRYGVRATDDVSFVVQPHIDAFVLRDADPYLQFFFDIADFDMDATLDASGEKILTSAPQFVVSGSIADAGTDTSRLALSTNNLSYQSSTISMVGGIIQADNVLQSTSKIKMHADRMNIVNLPLLSQDFTLDMNMVGAQTRAQLKFVGTPIVVQLEGRMSLPQRAFVGRVFVPPFEVSDLPQPLGAYWPDVPASLTNFAGELALAGQVNWAGAHSISGPISIGMKNFSFTANNAEIQGFNGVISADSLVPFVTTPSQHIFVQSVDGLLPLQNLDINFQADNQGLRLNQFEGLAAGIPVSLPASIISTKNSNMLLYLKNDAPITHQDMARVLNLKNVDVMAGTANLSIPVELQNGKFDMPNATLKMTNVLLHFTDGAYQTLFGFDPNYYVRNGQIILDKSKVLQLVLNGRMLPSKKQKDVQLNEVHLPNDVFVLPAAQPIPSDIQKRIHLLFDQANK